MADKIRPRDEIRRLPIGGSAAPLRGAVAPPSSGLRQTTPTRPQKLRCGARDYREQTQLQNGTEFAVADLTMSGDPEALRHETKGTVNQKTAASTTQETYVAQDNFPNR